MLELSEAAQLAIVEGARDDRPVAGLTHNFYRYPARFSPHFVRAVITSLTRPGDMVFDPYMGGGTSLVEALVLGRHATGVDISQLAEFVAGVKTTVYTDDELALLSGWKVEASASINMHGSALHFSDYDEMGYFKHLNAGNRWRLRKAISQALGGAIKLASPRLEAFARCAILRTSQWALDGRRQTPTVVEFREMLQVLTAEMIDGAKEFSQAVALHQEQPVARLLVQSAAELHRFWSSATPPPRLVVTSPPYPGIHMLYHRWQVDGGRETAAPFWIANKLDGAGSSYYTMGDRKSPLQNSYFSNLRKSTTSVAGICGEETVVVQMVAFSDVKRQLPRYLETMEESGLEETFLPILTSEADGRLWRRVPRRRWYSHQRGVTPGSIEVVLFHRLATPPMLPRPPSQIALVRAQ